MTYTTPMSTDHREPATRTLFKADHPRDIDQHIAFFGDEPPGGDMCGEALLDALTHRPSEAEETS